MQKTKISNLSDSDNFQSLPSIKNKLKTSANTPRVYSTKSPGGEQISFSPSPNALLSPLGSEELLITRIDENTKRKLTNKTHSFKENEVLPLKKKLKQLTLKTIDQEKYIKLLENQIKSNEIQGEKKNSGAEYMQETISSQNKKGELLKNNENIDYEEMTRDPISRYKYKDHEIFTLRQEIEDFSAKFNEVNDELAFFKDKNKQLEERLEKNQGKIAEYELERKKFQNNIKFIETKANENELDMLYKQNELEDLTYSLKKSEERRKLATEHSSQLENKNKSFKIKLSSLNRLKLEQEEDISRLTKECIEKDSQIEHLTSHISYLEASLEQEKSKNILLQMDSEKNKSVYSTDERFLSKIERLEKDNQLLNSYLSSIKHSNSHTPNRNISKRSDAHIESKYLSKLTAEEIARWQQRYFSAEQELISKYLELERKSKDEVYLHSQLDTKSLLIQKLEDIIQHSDPSSISIKTNSSSMQVNHFYDLLIIIEKMNRRCKDVMENIKCPSCFKLKAEYFITYPCSHLCCKACQAETDTICGKCTEKVTFMIPAVYLSGFIQVFSEEREDIDTLKAIASSNYILEAE